MKYNKNFLRNVLVRVDFFSPIMDMSKPLPEPLQNSIKTNFPIPQRTEIQIDQVQLGSLSIKPDSQSRMTEYDFYAGDQSARLAIGTNFLFIEESRYDGYETLCGSLFPVLDELFGLPGEPTIRRLGLRYQNLIPAPGKNPLDWNGYIDSSLLTAISRASASGTGLCKAMTSVEFNDGSARFILQYGIPNQDYPAPIRRKEFALDLDSFVSGIVERSQVRDTLDRLHSRIVATFEGAVLDKVRKAMARDS